MHCLISRLKTGTVFLLILTDTITPLMRVESSLTESTPISLLIPLCVVALVMLSLALAFLFYVKRRRENRYRGWLLFPSCDLIAT